MNAHTYENSGTGLRETTKLIKFALLLVGTVTPYLVRMRNSLRLLGKGRHPCQASTSRYYHYTHTHTH